MLRIVPRQNVSTAAGALAAVGACSVALVLAAIPIAAAGLPIGEAYGRMLNGVFGSVFTLSETLTRATPLIFTGLAAAIAFRARFWNIGAEGQLYLGALAAVAVGSADVGLPGWLWPSLVLLAGAVGGAAGLIGPAFLKTRFGADEVVTTLLLNFVILLFVQMMLEGPMQDPMGMGWPQSAPMMDDAMLSPLADRLRVHTGLLLAIVAASAVAFILYRTVWGFKLRAVGLNPDAAAHAGIPVGRTVVLTAILSGGLAGVAGASEVAGLKGYLTADLSPGFGYTGIVVAMLAGTAPLGVILSALFIAAVFVGADSMGRAMGAASALADLIVAISLLAVLVGGFLTTHRLRFVR